MKRLTNTAAIAIILAGLSAPVFADITRTTTGPQGNTATKNVAGDCTRSGSGTDCSSSVSRTTAGGETYTRDRNRSVTCENGSCNGSKSVNSLRGNTRTRNVTVTGN